MSRGPGALQRAVIEVIESLPGQEISRAELRRRFPTESKNKSLYRAIRGLLRTGHLLARGHSLVRAYPAFVGQVRYPSHHELRDLLKLLPKDARPDLHALHGMEEAPAWPGKAPGQYRR